MRFEDYLQADARLQKVDDLAKSLYAFAGAHIHNYQHARWDTNLIIRIGEEEKEGNMPLLISSGLLHDSGVSIGPYKNATGDLHAANGERVARLFLPQAGFSKEEVDQVAIAVGQHNETEPSKKYLRTLTTAKVLFDADTLNKAGVHGLDQYVKVNEEWGWKIEENREDLEAATTRYSPYSQKLVEHGFYTNTAQQIDREMGTANFGGLELVAKFWKTIEDKLRDGKLSASEIVQSARDKVEEER